MGTTRKLFSPEGRSNRLHYWLVGLTSSFAPLLLMLLLSAAVGGMHRGDGISFDMADLFRNPLSFGFGDSFIGAGPVVSRLLYAIAAPVGLAAVWVFAAATIRRLHDRNKSGWWIFHFYVAPVALNNFAARLDFSYATLAIGLIAMALSVWGCVETLFLQGTRGPNRFGADPLALPDTRPGWDQQGELEFVSHSAGPSPGGHVMRGHD
ncbi:DUF805 domain-containing protein [Rhodopseudomonas sp. P2A-2r]|uniref:DUF805 domain-containing protein n=1 Tax=unclassified Rhodopseudomonas TaxID=2638247 RepID=UPI002234D600|nr:DUF805 domain-containing protein [Rhodopseudomonas sp. P2A-2r]UZE50273.1 DUF805 domain-containing protein [Rhodopseudomonas sp. P2A-2r]